MDLSKGNYIIFIYNWVGVLFVCCIAPVDAVSGIVCTSTRDWHESHRVKVTVNRYHLIYGLLSVPSERWTCDNIFRGGRLKLCPLFSPSGKFSILQKHLFNSCNYIHIWLVPPQPSCGKTYQKGRWHSADSRCFEVSDKLRNNETE